jgi:short-subunit dehydrogenase
VTAREGEGRTVLITGASAGIGEALAHVFAEHGFALVLTARRRDRLEKVAKECAEKYRVPVHVFPADLANPDAGASLLAAIAYRSIAVDALVNNAGYGVPGLYRNAPIETHRDFLQVLVTAPCELTHLVLAGMMERGYGRILNVASVAGFMPGSSSHTLYSGSKAMMIKWSQALHSEQKGTGIFVTALCPGFTLTEFHDVNGTREKVGRLPKFLWLSAERVAKEGYKAVMKNKPLCVPGAQYKAITAIARFLPRNTAHRLGELRARVLKDVK